MCRFESGLRYHPNSLRYDIPNLETLLVSHKCQNHAIILLKINKTCVVSNLIGHCNMLHHFQLRYFKCNSNRTIYGMIILSNQTTLNLILKWIVLLNILAPCTIVFQNLMQDELVTEHQAMFIEGLRMIFNLSNS